MAEDQMSLLPEEKIKEIVKKQDGRRGQNSLFADTMSGSGDNARFINFINVTHSLPKVDISDTEQIAERINWYFEYCAEQDMRPTVTGLASAIGVTRATLWNWKNGMRRPQNYLVIEDAYSRLEELWELYMMNGKIHPANGIFLGKNHFGYKDEQNVIVTPNNPLGDIVSIEEIEEKYAELPDE